MFNFTPLLGAQSASPASQSLLEFDGGIKVLVDVGWDESFDVEKLRELERYALFDDRPRAVLTVADMSLRSHSYCLPMPPRRTWELSRISANMSLSSRASPCMRLFPSPRSGGPSSKTSTPQLPWRTR
jgi:hypothetical protein